MGIYPAMRNSDGSFETLFYKNFATTLTILAEFREGSGDLRGREPSEHHWTSISAFGIEHSHVVKRNILPTGCGPREGAGEEGFEEVIKTESKKES